MDTTKHIDVNHLQFCLASGVRLLPHVHEQMLNTLINMQQADLVCLLPSAIFEAYHLRLKKRLTVRIEQYKARKAKRKTA